MEFLTRGLRNKTWDLFFVLERSDYHFLVPHFFIFAQRRGTPAGFRYDVGTFAGIVNAPGFLSVTPATLGALKGIPLRIAAHNNKQFLMWNVFAVGSSFTPPYFTAITYSSLGPFVGKSCLSWTLGAAAAPLPSRSSRSPSEMAPASLLAIRFCSPGEQVAVQRALAKHFHDRGLVHSPGGAPERVEVLLVNTEIERWKDEKGLSDLASAAGEGVFDYVSRVGGGLRFAVVGTPGAVYFFEKARRVGGVLGKEWRTGGRRGITDVLATCRRYLPSSQPVVLRGFREVRHFLRATDAGLPEDAERELSRALLSAGSSWREWLDAGTGTEAFAWLEKLDF